MSVLIYWDKHAHNKANYMTNPRIIMGKKFDIYEAFKITLKLL